MNPSCGKLGVRHCPKASMAVCLEITKAQLNKIPSKKNPIVDIERLPKDAMKRKMDLSSVSSKSSTETK